MVPYPKKKKPPPYTGIILLLYRDISRKNVKMALNHAYSLSIWGLIAFPTVVLN